MGNQISILFTVLSLIVGFATVISSLIVPTKRLWIPIILCVILGFLAGFFLGESELGLFPSFFFSVVFIILFIPGGRLTRYFRKRALDRLEERGIKFW